jgi:hypothetical protein
MHERANLNLQRDSRMKTTIYLATASGLAVIQGCDETWAGEVCLSGKQIQCVAADRTRKGVVYCGTFGNGMLRSGDRDDRDFERSYGFEPAGGCAGLVPTAFNCGPLDVYFMGETDRENFERAGYNLLGCSCGEVGCWPLTARISRTPNHVVWDRFSQPFRKKRDYSSFGPFRFNLDQYTRAIPELASKFPASAGR